MSSVAPMVLPDEHAPELISSPEWHSVCSRQHNLLLEGPEHATEGLLLLLKRYLRTPVVWTRGSMPLELPADECGAVVVQNVSAIGRHGQAALLKWLDGNKQQQVISTTVRPLFPLIARGRFDEALYYRLNIMLMRVDSTVALV